MVQCAGGVHRVIVLPTSSNLGLEPMTSSRRIRTVLYGDQRMEASEIELLHTPAFQRLYDLHQLGLTDRIFVDASHSRLQHVIGVLQQVDNIVDAVVDNLWRRESRTLQYRKTDGTKETIPAPALGNYIRTRRRAARLMGLLHDITHAPFGHTLEDEIELQTQKHDDPTRQADAFFRLLVQYIGWAATDNGSFRSAKRIQLVGDSAATLEGFLSEPALCEPPESAEFIEFVARLAAKQVTEASTGRGPTRTELINLFRDLRFAMRALLWLDALHKDNLDDLLPPSSPDRSNRKSNPILPDGTYGFEKLIDRVLALAGEPVVAEDERFVLQRDAFLLDIIGNTICADLLDYAKRDSHFAGLKLDYDVDRIVENFTIVPYRRPRKGNAGYARLEPFLRTAISIFSHKLRVDVPGELMNLLQVRFYVYQRVLFHPTKCIAGAMLGSALQLIGWKNLPKQYRFVGDAVFLNDVAEVAQLVRGFLLRHEATPQKLIKDITRDFTDAIDGIGGIAITDAAVDLFRARVSDTVESVLRDLDAALRLLQRLGARRYHRPIFRLLPNVRIPELSLDASRIADHFLKADIRGRAEREIEMRAGLPLGSITIHCPKGDGPKKIAEILILSEKDGKEEVYPLREIRAVDEKIFEKHEHAITAVEEMYASMWRLIVSVAPPHHKDYPAINRVISRVLYAELSGDSYESLYYLEGREVEQIHTVRCVPNDTTMERELGAELTAGPPEAPMVQLIYSDGHYETRNAAFIAAADLALPMLAAADPRIAPHLEAPRTAAEWKTESDLRGLLEEMLPQASQRAVDATVELGEQIRAPTPTQPTLTGLDVSPGREPKKKGGRPKGG